MTAEIVALDAALDRAGEDVVLSRVVKRSGVNVAATVTCRAAVRAVRSDEIVGAMKITDMTVVISPTQIVAADWPGQDDNATVGVDKHIPRVTDSVTIQGKPKQIIAAKPIFVGGVWVRTDMVVSG